MAVNTKGLQAAYDRKTAGTASKTDIANLDYAFKNSLWSPPSLAKSASAPSATKTATSTLKGYDVNQGGKEVYVQPGTYNKGISSTPINNIKDAGNLINANQEADANKKAAEDGPKTRLDETTQMLNDYSNLFSGGKEKVEAPSMEKTFAELQATQGTAELESQMADLNKDEKAIQARIRARKDYEASKPVAMGVISGKQAEIVKQEQEELDNVSRQKSYLTEQLNSKYNMVNTIMNLKQTDYKNAVDSYDKQFNQNIQTINFIRGVQNDQQTKEDREKASALANLQIVSNAITGGALSFKDLPADQKAQVSKFELLAGLPIGFTEALKSKTPNSDIISTTSRVDASNNKYADIVLRDNTTGKITVQSQFLGKEKASASGSTVSPEEKERKQEVANFQKDSSEWIAKLDEKDEYGNLKYSWGTAYDSMKVKYPQFEGLVDEALGGGLDKKTGEYYGRAKR